MKEAQEHLNWLARVFVKAKTNTKGHGRNLIHNTESNIRLIIDRTVNMHLPFTEEVCACKIKSPALSQSEIMEAAGRVVDLFETISDEQLITELSQLKDGAIAEALRGNNDA